MSGAVDGRWDVPAADVLRRLALEPLPLGLRATAPERVFLRDVYYDTSDLTLRARRVTCRVRHRSDGRRELSVSLVEERDGEPTVTRTEAGLTTGTPAAEALGGESEPALLLRSIVNPGTLGVHLELEIERYTRTGTGRQLVRPARFSFEYDIVTVRAAGVSRTFHEVLVRAVRRGRPSAEQLARAVSEELALRSLTIDRRERAEQVRAALESEALARGVGSGRWVAIAALDGSLIATLLDGDTRRLPVAEGSGESACRHLMRRALGSSVGDLHLLTTTLGEGRLRSLEVWICTRVDRSADPLDNGALEWIPIEEMLARVGTTEINDAATLAALALLSKSEMLPRLVSLPSAQGVEERTRERRGAAVDAKRPADPGDGPTLDVEASLLAFNGRVLELAEDASVPLLERLRYLAIVASNLDEFFAVQVGSLKYEGRDVADESRGTGPASERLAAIATAARALIARQQECLSVCLRALAGRGIRVRGVAEVSAPEQEHLLAYFKSTVFPYLTPRAITATPGHSLPIVADRALCFAVALREGTTRPDAPLHSAELAVPAALPRFVPLPGTADVVPLEEVIRGGIALAYPGRRVEHAHLFRVTRYADLGVDEPRAGNLTQAVEEHAQRRRHQPVVRIEVEAAMPSALRELLLRELQLEPGARAGGIGPNDVYEIRGLMDLDGLRPLADLPLPGLSFPPFRPRRAIPEARSLWETIREGDVLLHHPYDDFSTSVVRFFTDAADDPDVPAMKVALYRAGERSPIVEALRRASAAGKDVSVFVELKARFDEQRNVRWTKQLEASGAHVVQGLPGYKNHSKIALIVRRESDGLRRYAHVGTGNYNAGTARVYTDLGLLTARESVCDDVMDLFNTLTGSSVPTNVAYRECLVAPHGLLPALLARIERETEHARAGRRGRIRMKVNGVSDAEVVQALYRAAQAGVEIDLVVRGLCTLRPGLPGLSERIRVVSVLGRFLEHARIFVFDNSGAPEYFIGSADMRPRNLRRRVEVLVPVHSAPHRQRLDAILDQELSDQTAWLLEADGSYTRRSAVRGPRSEVLPDPADVPAPSLRSAQDHFAAEAEASSVGATT
jgi:polyphosphate kinase